MDTVVYGFLMGEGSRGGRKPTAKIILTSDEIETCMSAVAKFWDDKKDSLLVIEAGESEKTPCGAEKVAFRGKEWHVHRAPKSFCWDRKGLLPVVE